MRFIEDNQYEQRNRIIMALLAGCATIFGGSSQPITLNSDSPGGTYQYGIYSGKTPATIEASRAELAHAAVLTLAGYQSVTDWCSGSDLG